MNIANQPNVRWPTPVARASNDHIDLIGKEKNPDAEFNL